MNLFRQVPDGPGSVTAALLAFMEHSDHALVGDLLRKAGIEEQMGPGIDVRVSLPGPGGNPAIGQLTAADFGVTIYAQTPGEPLDLSSLSALPGTVLTVTTSGQAPEGVHHLSWEQVERWLTDVMERYDPDSRTGFLVRQFQEYLHDLGIESFPGFSPGQLRDAPAAIGTVRAIYERAEQFFDRLEGVFAELPGRPASIRRARAEDLLTGYAYRDFGGLGFAASGFIRVALNLSTEQFQLSCWLPGDLEPEATGRLRKALLNDAGFAERLRGLEGEPLLWLWSTAGERKVSLEEFEPASVEDLDWSQYQVALQQHLDFKVLPLDDLIGRLAGMVEALVDVISSVLAGPVH